MKRLNIKTIWLAIAISLAFVSAGRCQCNADFTYTVGPQSLYQFTSTSSQPLGYAAFFTWFLRGPNISDLSHAISPSYYFTVNGTYYVTLETGFHNCSSASYKIDTIVITGLTGTGNCNADYTYYPTCCGQFQFTDHSVSTDSIISNYWCASTPDTFIQSNGLGEKNPVMTIWSYNCTYDYYIVTHAVTTISGCQSVKTDTIHTFCDECFSQVNANWQLNYQAATNTYSFHDITPNQGESGYYYWQFSFADTVIYSTEQNPVFANPSSGIVSACFYYYDTLTHCVTNKCDSVQQILSLGKKIADEEQWFLKPVRRSDTKWAIECNRKGELAFLIFDLTGRKVFEKSVYNDGESFELDIPVAASGIYVATIEQRDFRISGKLFR